MRSHTLKTEQWLPRARAEVFPFFAEARNLDVITPPWLKLEVLTPGPIEMGAGTLIDYRLLDHVHYRPRSGALIHWLFVGVTSDRSSTRQRQLQKSAGPARVIVCRESNETVHRLRLCSPRAITTRCSPSSVGLRTHPGIVRRIERRVGRCDRIARGALGALADRIWRDGGPASVLMVLEMAVLALVPLGNNALVLGLGGEPAPFGAAKPPPAAPQAAYDSLAPEGRAGTWRVLSPLMMLSRDLRGRHADQRGGLRSSDQPVARAVGEATLGKEQVMRFPCTSRASALLARR
jgi:hypothetical protein